MQQDVQPQAQNQSQALTVQGDLGPPGRPVVSAPANVNETALSAPQRRDTQKGKVAMGNIETSVTKLLIATKQLLESLTQWSRRLATENDVSDVYVSLGNEFNRAVICFQQAGIDMSDLEQTPDLLREILEHALGEDASPASLDRFLPRIREIIINLLQGLKRKQQIHRIQNGEAAAGPPRSRRNDSNGSGGSVSTSTTTSATTTTAGGQAMTRFASQERTRSPAASMASTGRSHSDLGYPSGPAPERGSSHTTSTGTHPGPRISQQATQRRLPQLPGEDRAALTGPRPAPEPPGTVPYSETRRDGNTNLTSQATTTTTSSTSTSDPVTQLNQLGQLERRSSKRFSDNYLAQLTSSPGSASLDRKMTVDGVRNKMARQMPDVAEDEEQVDRRESLSPGRRRSRSSVAGTQLLPSVATRAPVLYLACGARTKKVAMPEALSVEGLQKLMQETFTLEEMPVLVVANPGAVAYELEEVKDVLDGTTLQMQPVSTAQQTDKDKDKDVASTVALSTTTTPAVDDALKSWLEGRLQSLSKQIAADLKQTLPSSTPVAQSLGSPQIKAKALPESTTDDQLKALQAQLETLSTAHATLERQNAALEAQLVAKLESPSAVAAQASGAREEVISLTVAFEGRCTELTAKTEELMNDIDTVRVDLAKRKVSPRPQQLQALSDALAHCLAEAASLRLGLRELDSKSNHLWEGELLTITREQEALEYHKAYMADMDTDLAGYGEVLQTVHKVEEQKKLSPGQRKQPVVLDTTGDPSTAIKFVQADIKSLHVNHEARQQAIEAAERHRERERVYLLENLHTKEVAQFVASKQLKATGGAEEVERRRQLKDAQHRKQFFTPPGTPVREESQEILAAASLASAASAAGAATRQASDKEESPDTQADGQTEHQAEDDEENKIKTDEGQDEPIPVPTIAIDPSPLSPVVEAPEEPSTISSSIERTKSPDPTTASGMAAGAAVPLATKTASSSAVLNRISNHLERRTSRLFSAGSSVSVSAPESTTYGSESD